MSEIISLHIGQAGFRIGQSNYSLLTHDHNLNLDGSANNNEKLGDGFSSFFSQISNDKFRARWI